MELKTLDHSLSQFGHRYTSGLRLFLVKGSVIDQTCRSRMIELFLRQLPDSARSAWFNNSLDRSGGSPFASSLVRRSLNEIAPPGRLRLSAASHFSQGASFLFG